MNRRNFLRRAFAVAAVAVIAPTAILHTAPAVEIAKVKRVGRSVTYTVIDDPAMVKGGVTQEQLGELIKATLKDLPQGMMKSIWATPHHSITDIYRSKA